jgi:hypothetical protein
MSKRTALLSSGYWFSAYTLGLLLHPYKTARELGRRRVFRPLLWAPLIFWIMVYLVGFLGLRFGGGVLRLMGVMTTPGWLVGILAFLFWWLTVFLLLWQLLLAYLGNRFSNLQK